MTNIKPTRRILRLSGKDTRDFLQGLVTNDINKIDGGLVYGAILILVIGERWYRGIYRRRLAREGRLPTTP